VRCQVNLSIFVGPPSTETSTASNWRGFRSSVDVPPSQFVSREIFACKTDINTKINLKAHGKNIMKNFPLTWKKYLFSHSKLFGFFISAPRANHLPKSHLILLQTNQRTIAHGAEGGEGRKPLPIHVRHIFLILCPLEEGGFCCR